jgi:hypothetical protein
LAGVASLMEDEAIAWKVSVPSRSGWNVKLAVTESPATTVPNRQVLVSPPKQLPRGDCE